MMKSVNGIFLNFFRCTFIILAKNIFFFRKNETRTKKIQVHFIIFYPLTVKRMRKFNTF